MAGDCANHQRPLAGEFDRKQADWFRCGAFSMRNCSTFSRLPFVMAWDGWLPARFRNATSETAVPKLAIVCLCGITALFTALSYGGLAVIQCILYAAALTLEFLR